mgnify:CR=1 FL=1
MDAAEKLLFENINKNLDVIRSEVTVINTNISKLFSGLTEQGTKLAELYKQHDERACYIDDFLALKNDYGEHKIINGFANAEAEKNIEGLSKDVAPVRTIKAGWAVLVAIVSIIGILTFVQVKMTNMMNYIKAIETVEVQP